jgi:hypothetical protein
MSAADMSDLTISAHWLPLLQTIRWNAQIHTRECAQAPAWRLSAALSAWSLTGDSSLAVRRIRVDISDYGHMQSPR